MKEVNNNLKRLHLFSCIKLTKGVKRGVIIDLERGGFLLVPNDLIDFLIKNDGEKVEDVFLNYDKSDHETITDYFRYLLENDIIFYNNLSSEYFPPISDEWDSFSTITNCIVDAHSIESLKRLYNVVTCLEVLNCQHIELRFFFKINLNDLEKVVLSFDNSIIKSIELTMPFVNNKEGFEKLLDEYPRVMDVNLYHKEKQHFESEHPIFFVQSDNPSLSCGVINAKSFLRGIEAYTEAKMNNSCLNRKLALNLDSGDIKNCPSLPEVHGNFMKEEIVDIILTKEFQKYWTVTKNEIEKCNLCEFRDICSDCRAFTEKNDEGFGKPLKCGYDPNSGIWENWEENKEKKIRFQEICNTL